MSEARIKALREKLAEKQGLAEEQAIARRIYMYSTDYEYGAIAKRSFQLGAEALAEVHRLRGEIRAYRQMRELHKFIPGYVTQKEQELEALLSEKEQG